ncbi:MAG: hypothetical protein IKN26_02860 [Eubacterium sp.]|nr:hypothetical protein [Eubacterium sp.]
MENPFIAKARLQSLRRYLPVSQNFIDDETYIPEDYLFNELPEYQPINRLGENMAQSMRMMADIQKLKGSLPGIDCGACGAPSCRALAEDIIKGRADVGSCPILKNSKGEQDDS